MPERELVEALERADRHRARTILVLFAVAVMGLLALVAWLSYSAEKRSDRASRSACTLVGVVSEQNRLLTSGLSVLITPPGTERDQALAALTNEVKQNEATARRIAQTVKC